MTDFEREIIRLWVNQPASFVTFIKEFASIGEIDLYDQIDDLINNELPADSYCKNCIDGTVLRIPGDDGDDVRLVCDNCGSFDIEG
jgi:hypothetical protein